MNQIFATIAFLFASVPAMTFPIYLRDSKDYEDAIKRFQIGEEAAGQKAARILHAHHERVVVTDPQFVWGDYYVFSTPEKAGYSLDTVLGWSME